ncbi:MFS domain-containing protein [Fusarium sp. LHS14.1]|nr:MFS domain-containing protein [Fusarium sp. LHS14.1]
MVSSSEKGPGDTLKDNHDIPFQHPEAIKANQHTTQTVLTTAEEPPYSVFTKWQKRWINMNSSFAAMFSTLSSYIYYPALTSVSQDLGVSLSLINLTVTSYLIVAGIAPAFLGDMADQSGRRPIYMLMFVLMISANIGIALQRSFPALLVLRMLQSAGSSRTAMISAGYGVIADITAVNERGGFVGILLVMTDIAPSLGPVIGGAITNELGWRWIFWFLVILTGTHFIILVLFMPETQRNIVGDGSGKVTGIYWSFFTLFQSRETRPEIKRPKRRYPNPLSCLPILRHKESFLTILIYAITYSVKMTLQTALGAQCVEIYNLNYLTSGLVYLPSGVSGGIASYFTGRYLDWNYKKTGEKLSGYGRDSPQFPIERTRLKGIFILITISSLGTLGYGLALMTKAHISVMLIMQFLTGGSTASTFTMTSTLLTDLNLNRSATAHAASNIVRCLMAGGAIGIMDPLIKSIGFGWCFGIYAAVALLEIPVVVYLYKMGDRRTQQHGLS